MSECNVATKVASISRSSSLDIDGKRRRAAVLWSRTACAGKVDRHPVGALVGPEYLVKILRQVRRDEKRGFVSLACRVFYRKVTRRVGLRVEHTYLQREALACIVQCYTVVLDVCNQPPVCVFGYGDCKCALGKSVPCQAGSWLALSVFSDQNASDAYNDSRPPKSWTTLPRSDFITSIALLWSILLSSRIVLLERMCPQ